MDFGIFVTDANGQIKLHVKGEKLYPGEYTVTGLAPNSTVVVSKKKAPTGYILDETPKNIVVRTGVANSLIFDDEPCVTIIAKEIRTLDGYPLDTTLKTIRIKVGDDQSGDTADAVDGNSQWALATRVSCTAIPAGRQRNCCPCPW